MHFLDIIFSIVWDISSRFYDIAQWFRRLPLIGGTDLVMWIADGFLNISNFFWGLLTPIAHAHDWVVSTTDRIAQILNIDAIIALLRQWLNWAEWAWDWVRNAWYYVTGWITDWWLSTQITVQGWITAATQGLNDLVVAWSNFWTITWPAWTSSFNSLKAAWDDFWLHTFPNLVNFSWLIAWWVDRVKDVQNLITTAFTLRESWWAGWQEMRAQVVEFFADPYQWVYDRLDEFFERFW